MKKSYLFAGLLLGVILPTVALCAPSVTGKLGRDIANGWGKQRQACLLNF
jgi:uncharacterized membrane protein (DUF441 family)